MNILLLMMGGSGTRFGARIPKQYVEVEGCPVFMHIVRKYVKSVDLEKVVLVSNPTWVSFVKEKMEQSDMMCTYEVVEGGDTRSQSVKNGLLSAMKTGKKDDVILIHDATHPYVDVEGVKQIISIVEKGRGATMGQFQYDTVYQIDREQRIESVLQRQNVVSGASPEAFPLGLIYEIYKKATPAELEIMTSAGAIAAAYGIPVEVVRTEVLNLKITYQNDMELFQCLFEYYFADAI